MISLTEREGDLREGILGSCLLRVVVGQYVEIK